MLRIELLEVVIDILISETRTNLAVGQATLNLIPILSIANPLLQPIGVITEPILLIPTTRHDLPCALVGDSEGEDGENREKKNEEEHYEKVTP